MESKEAKIGPRALTEEEVLAAAEGRSEEVLGKSKPIELTEAEVKAAAAGKSEDIVSKKSLKGP